MLQKVQSLISTVPQGESFIPWCLPPVPSHDTLWVQQSLNVLGANPPLAEDGVSGPLTHGGGGAVPAGEWPVPVGRRRCGNDRGDRAQTADAGPRSGPDPPRPTSSRCSSGW